MPDGARRGTASGQSFRQLLASVGFDARPDLVNVPRHGDLASAIARSLTPACTVERFSSHLIVQTIQVSVSDHHNHFWSHTMKPKFETYAEPAGVWGSVGSLRRSLTHERVLLSGARILLHQNKPAGFACVSCSWAKPARPRPFEFCEEGAKATTWEITTRRCGPDFFAEHTVTELESWSDHALEERGRLTHPMRYDAAADKYVPVAWAQAIAEIASETKKFDPKQVVFYSSGRASLEASYMYALFARLYGNNNLPDSSNMCHESTSVGLPLSIGVPVGTVTLPDFEKTDCLVFIGHNTGINAPRMLHALQGCAKRGVPIIVFNPLRERGF
jgi:anaerobic selenocysteine-containing dehydrogenase